MLILNNSGCLLKSHRKGVVPFTQGRPTSVHLFSKLKREKSYKQALCFYMSVVFACESCEMDREVLL